MRENNDEFLMALQYEIDLLLNDYNANNDNFSDVVKGYICDILEHIKHFYWAGSGNKYDFMDSLAEMQAILVDAMQNLNKVVNNKNLELNVEL